jgi:hypothetical protein
MPKYQFVVGVSLAALEADLNRIVQEEPSLKLHQIMYAQGTGFVAVVERAEGVEVGQPELMENREKSSRERQRPRRQ